jgi:hypothetical protein
MGRDKSTPYISYPANWSATAYLAVNVLRYGVVFVDIVQHILDILQHFYGDKLKELNLIDQGTLVSVR